MPGNQFDGICECAESEYILGAVLSISTGEYDVDSGITEGLDSEVGELERWTLDYGDSRHMASSHDSMTNYCEYSGIVRAAGGEILPLPIEGVGDIHLRFRSDTEAFDVQLLDVAFVRTTPESQRAVVQQFTASHHAYFRTKDRAEWRFRSGRTLKASKVSRANLLRRFCVPTNDKSFSCNRPWGATPLF